MNSPSVRWFVVLFVLAMQIPAKAQVTCPGLLAGNAPRFLANLDHHLDSLYRLLIERRAERDQGTFLEYLSPYRASGSTTTIQTGHFLLEALPSLESVAAAKDLLEAHLDTSAADYERLKKKTADVVRRVEHITKFLGPELRTLTETKPNPFPGSSEAQYAVAEIDLEDIAVVLRRGVLGPQPKGDWVIENDRVKIEVVRNGEPLPRLKEGKAQFVLSPQVLSLASWHRLPLEGSNLFLESKSPLSLLDLLWVRTNTKLAGVRLRDGHVAPPAGVNWSDLIFEADVSPTKPKPISERLNVFTTIPPTLEWEIGGKYLAGMPVGKIHNAARADRFSATALLDAFAEDPFLGDLYSRSVGVTEGLTLYEHTIKVLNQFEHYFPNLTFPMGITRDIVRVAIAIHDIGKPRATTLWPAGDHHEETRKIADPLLKRLGLSGRQIAFVKAIIDGDPIGPMLRAKEEEDYPERLSQAADFFIAGAQASGCAPMEFFPIMVAFYMSDASAYTPDAGSANSPVASRFIFDRPGRKLLLQPPNVLRILELQDRVAGAR